MCKITQYHFFPKTVNMSDQGFTIIAGKLSSSSTSCSSDTSSDTSKDVIPLYCLAKKRTNTRLEQWGYSPGAYSTVEKRRLPPSAEGNIAISAQFMFPCQGKFTLSMPDSREIRHNMESWELELLETEIKSMRVIREGCHSHSSRGWRCTHEPMPEIDSSFDSDAEPRNVDEIMSYKPTTNECTFYAHKMDKKELETRKYILHYMKHPVGSFVGPWDRSVTENLKLGTTSLSFSDYTIWQHFPENKHYEFDIDYEVYQRVSRMDQIYSLKVMKENTSDESELCGPVQNLTGDKMYYTCTGHKCKIPCVCDNCVTGNVQCIEHQVDQSMEFSQKHDLFSVRNSDSFNMNYRCPMDHGVRLFLNINGLILTNDPKLQRIPHTRWMNNLITGNNNQPIDIIKYPGIPNKCDECVDDLLNHEAYHLIDHHLCKFCNPIIRQTYEDITTNQEYFTNQWDRRYDELFSCKICGTSFSTLKDKKKHIEFIHNRESKVKIKCKKCKFTTIYQKNMNEHIDNVHNKNRKDEIKCQQCEFTTIYSRSMNEHVDKFHNKNIKDEIKCEKCEFTTIYKKNMNKHVDKVHKENYIYYNCDKCEYKSVHKRNVTEHTNTVHKGSQTKFKCEMCNYETAINSNLTKHKKNIHEKELQKQYNCDVCDYVTTIKSNLRRHIQTVHEKAS